MHSVPQELFAKQALDRSGVAAPGHFGLPGEVHLTAEQAKLLYGLAFNGGGSQLPGGPDARFRGPFQAADMAQAQGFRTKG